MSLADIQAMKALKAVKNLTTSTKLANFTPDNLNLTSAFTESNLQAIKVLKLYGFDTSKPHRLRVMARNHSSFKYRIIISHKNGSVWQDVFDTGSTFTITENASGLTRIDYSIGSKRIVMIVDYNNLGFSGVSLSDTDMTNAKYNISPSCHAFDSPSTSAKKMIATKNGTTAKFKFRYNDTQNMILEFGLLGINQLSHLKAIYKENSNVLNEGFDNLTSFSTVDTDWVSPYGLSAVNNGNGNTAFTVGGNHGTNGATGFATARRQSVNFYADGKLMQDNTVYHCDSVTVKAVHYISAYNAISLTDGTKRDSVKEDVAYTITPKNIEVSVSLTALEDVTFTQYTGLQATLAQWNDEGYFMMDNSAVSYTNPGSTIVNSATKAQADSDRFVARKGTDFLIGYMNRRVGIGNRDYISTSTQNIQFSSNGKAYIQNVNNGSVTVTTGSTICWNGGWTLTEVLSSNNFAKAAYFINLLGKRVYCVDVFTAGTGFVEVLPEDYNKEIEVISKSDSITPDSFIVSKGLKVTATGYGQLKFTVK